MHPRLHLLRHLSPVLLALQRALGGHDGFDELILRRVAQFHVQTFHAHTTLAEGIAQIEIGPRVAAGAFEIVDDDDKALIGLRINEAEQIFHARAFEITPAAGHGIRKDGGHLIAFLGGVLSTAGFLGLKPMAFFLLSARGNPGINQCFELMVIHFVPPLRSLGYPPSLPRQP
nr:hypothetical protein [Leisingera aquaemixtae]